MTDMCLQGKLPVVQQGNQRRLQHGQHGMTLVEILVVLAIIASLAAIIYPAVVDSLKKSQAAMIAQRLDAVQKAKVQYQLDQQTSSDPLPPDTSQVQIGQIAQYLTKFGVQISGASDLNQGTGGAIDLGEWGSNPYFVPSGASSNEYIAKYGIPTGPLPQGTPGPN
jgi:prepilin-type N-terminal cleavage/methylation domain-containing protein